MGFLGGAALLTAAVAVSKLLGALYKIPLGNLLGSRGMGCFQAAYNVYGVLLTLSTAGLPLAMSRLIAQSRGSGAFSMWRWRYFWRWGWWAAV